MNVDIPTITIAGAVAVGANGFARTDEAPYSDFVEEVELVTGDRRAADGEPGARPGALARGVVQPRGLRRDDEASRCASRRRSGCACARSASSMARAVDEMPAVLRGHDYAQHFWFPAAPAGDRADRDRTDAPRTLGPAHHAMKGLRGWASAAAPHARRGAARASSLAHDDRFGQVALASIGRGRRRDGPDREHAPRRVDQRHGAEPERLGQLPPGGQRLRGCPGGMAHRRRARRSEARQRGPFSGQSRDEHTAVRPVHAWLHGAPGDGCEQLCNIQITSFDNPHWEPFQVRLMEAWLRIPGARPHWAKQFQNVPGITARIAAVYGEHLDAFRRVHAEWAVDPDGVFLSPFMRGLLFAP
jgi:hypothetical protein